MTDRTDADEEWKIEPAMSQRGWWAVGYIYRGAAGTHQGQFVPVAHYPRVEQARKFADAMEGGQSRHSAKALASAE